MEPNEAICLLAVVSVVNLVGLMLIAASVHARVDRLMMRFRKLKREFRRD